MRIFFSAILIAALLISSTTATIDYAASIRGNGELEWDYDGGPGKSSGRLLGESALGHTSLQEWNDYKENITVDSEKGNVRVRTLEFMEQIRNAEDLKGSVVFGRSFRDTEVEETEENIKTTTTTRHHVSAIATNMSGTAGQFDLLITVPGKDYKPIWSSVNYAGKEFEIINSLKLSGQQTWTTEEILDAPENQTE